VEAVAVAFAETRPIILGPPGAALAVCQRRGLELIDWATGKSKGVMDWDRDEVPSYWDLNVWALRVGRVGGAFRPMRVFRTGSVTTKPLPATFALVRASPDGRTAVFRAGDNTVRLWDADAWEVRTVLPWKADHLEFAAFTPDGRTLLGRTFVTKILTPDEPVRVRDVADLAEERVLYGPGRAFSVVTVSPDGRALAAVESFGPVWVWDLATGKEKARLGHHVHTTRALAIGPGGGTVVLHYWPFPQSEEVEVWDVAGGRVVAHWGGLSHVTISPDGRTLVGVQGGRLRLWDIPTGR
jgi:WD40 repeat protein